MSDALRSKEVETSRQLRPEECALLNSLLRARGTGGVLVIAVADMRDGGMGSIRFAPFESARRYGSTLAEAQYLDADGVPVSIALQLDEQGRLLELDLWKVDFSPLVRYPTPADLAVQPIGPNARQVAQGSGIRAHR